MQHARALRFLACATILTLCAAASARAQQLSGTVVESEVMLPVPGASVVLLDRDMNVVARTQADGAGRFELAASGRGPFTLQGEAGGRFSSLLSLPEPAGGATDGIILVVPSVVLDLAATCPATTRDPVLVGRVFDAESGVPVPSVRVMASWPGGGSSTATTDRAGRYRICGVPGGAEIEIRAEGLGRTTQSRFQVPEADLVRADLALELGAGASQLRILGTAPLAGASATGEISGRIRSADPAEPVTGVSVRTAGSANPVLVGEDGRFRLAALEPGDVVVEVEHIAFGTQREVVPVQRGARTDVELTLVPRPIALRAIEVQGSAAQQLAARAVPHRTAVMSGVRLADAEKRGAKVPDVLRQIPGIRIMEGTFTTKQGIVNGVCVTSTRPVGSLTAQGGSARFPWCESMPLIVNGVPVSDPVDFLRNLNVADYESIQVLGAMEAQIMFGMAGGGAGGAVLLWTRGSGPYTSADRNR